MPRVKTKRKSVYAFTAAIGMGIWLIGSQQVVQLVEFTVSLSSQLEPSLLLEEHISPHEKPQIAWLLSFPNSGTSYTLAMVEEASGRSIGSNYGLEFVNQAYPIPVQVHETGYPMNQSIFWEGMESDIRLGTTVRPLPDRYILTKTHAGGRCIKCDASEYLQTAEEFLQAATRSTFHAWVNKTSNKNNQTSQPVLKIQEGTIDSQRVVRAVHLFRNPFDNVVSRFHLASRNKAKKKNKTPIPRNATGFRNYCRTLDHMLDLDADVDQIWNRVVEPGNEWSHVSEPSKYRPTSRRELRRWMKHIPCVSEFVKYVQWHDHVYHHVLPRLGRESVATVSESGPSTPSVPVYTLFYEDYERNLPTVAERLLSFLHLPNTVTNSSEYRNFRMSDYSDHYSDEERRAIAKLLRGLATPATWKLIRHYLIEFL